MPQKVKSKRGIHRTGLQPCNHEEAERRILLYVQDNVWSEFKKFMILANDTDVVISLYVFFNLGVDELWIEYGFGRHHRRLPKHSYTSALGEELCRALPFWYALTGCDTVSLFAGRRKNTVSGIWNRFPEATSYFVTHCMFELLSLITLRHLKGCAVCCDPN